MGLKCYEVMAGSGLTPDCADGCASVHYARVWMVPAPTEMRMRCASGARKLLRVQPMVVSGVADTGPLVVYLFGDASDQEATGGRTMRLGSSSPGPSGPLTARELEVLRYLALAGMCRTSRRS